MLATPTSASLDDLLRALDRGPVVAHGWTPAYAIFAAATLADPAGAPVVLVVADDAAARTAESDLRLWRPDLGNRIAVLPAIDVSPYADLSPDRQAIVQRLTTLVRLGRGGELAPAILIAPAPALLRRTLPARDLADLGMELVKGETIDRDHTAATLERCGFERVPVVEDPGTFAVRGGVIDVFAPLQPYPVRVELFGDEVESLRLFDPESQRTLREIDRVLLHPVRETIATGGADPRARIRDAADHVAHPSKLTRRLIEQVETGETFVGIETLTPAFHARMDPPWQVIPAGATWIVADPDAVRAAAVEEWDDAERRYDERVAAHIIAFPPGDHYASPDELDAALAAPRRRVLAPTLELHGDPRAEGATAMRFEIDDLRGLRSELERLRVVHGDAPAEPLSRAALGWITDGLAVVIAAGGHDRADRLAGLLEHHHVSSRRADDGERPDRRRGAITLSLAALSAGFASRADRIAALTAADVFGPRKSVTARQKAAAKRAKDALLGAVSDFSQLTAGDYLVHQLHGVGRYQGLVRLPVDSGGALAIDFLHLEYDGGQLYLPVYRLGEVQRYVGAENQSPRIDKLGGVSWEKARTKASRQVKALAEELLQIYASRKILPGHRFPPPDEMYRDFEATFPFEETPDQQAAIDAVFADMESEKAMDRLVCGDVGYGKTEVALRSIFKAALAGKQAVLLAPTTVLVEQHARTMKDRFAGWPVTLGKLSRFQTKSEQTDVVKGLAEGKVDVVVGTHRLLSADVRFRDLGLIVIDEEQRFGVAHKERLKKMRAQVDVLTLTATPIPRTLHLAMTGMRDLSIIATPPADRRAVRTFVSRLDEATIKEAITKELQRGGQVFWIARHIGATTSRVAGKNKAKTGPLNPDDRSLGEWADFLQELVPTARIGIAHGELPETELERVMIEFVEGKTDILISTTIVESGLDIPRANTMFVARADAFGLSQLYQLRGRIGRSRERAYCYLLVPAPDKLTDEARRRLEALQRFTELGAGFHIASQDLEIRGGGELLGNKQSGAIAAVGFETYVRMLEEAVAELRGEPIHHPIDPELTVDVPGYIPDDYVPDPGQRLDLYKRLSSAEDEEEIRAVVEEISDRWGPVPADVLLLADLMGVKALARRLRAVSVELTRSRLALALSPSTTLDPLRVVGTGGWKPTPDGRLLRPLTGDEQKAPAQAARRLLLELSARAT